MISNLKYKSTPNLPHSSSHQRYSKQTAGMVVTGKMGYEGIFWFLSFSVFFESSYSFSSLALQTNFFVQWFLACEIMSQWLSNPRTMTFWQWSVIWKKMGKIYSHFQTSTIPMRPNFTFSAFFIILIYHNVSSIKTPLMTFDPKKPNCIICFPC